MLKLTCEFDIISLYGYHIPLCSILNVRLDNKTYNNLTCCSSATCRSAIRAAASASNVFSMPPPPAPLVNRGLADGVTVAVAEAVVVAVVPYMHQQQHATSQHLIYSKHAVVYIKAMWWVWMIMIMTTRQKNYEEIMTDKMLWKGPPNFYVCGIQFLENRAKYST